MVKISMAATSIIIATISSGTFAQEHAVVVHVEPKHALMQKRVCEPAESKPLEVPVNTGGAVLGAVGGAYIGNQIGRGSGKDIATAAGAVIGYNIGAGTHSQNQHRRQVCRDVVVHSQSGEVVTFEYRGKRFTVNFDFF